MNVKLLELAKTLNLCGFNTNICENKEQAVDLIKLTALEYGECNAVGFGNSVTLKSLGLHEILSGFAKNIYIHSPIGTGDTDRKALTADLYFTSANAISLDGHIVNIDGTGNRTSATCFGPKQVIYVVGKNKVVKTLEEAMGRAKKAAVVLAKQYNRKTPCTITGKCEDCISPESICAVTTIHRKKPYGVKISVILIDEELGI